MAGDDAAQVRPVDADGSDLGTDPGPDLGEDPGGGGLAQRVAWLCAFTAGVAVIGIGLATLYLGGEGLDATWIVLGPVQLVAFAAPWVVGAALLQIRPRWGTAVLVALGGLTLLELVPVFLEVFSAPDLRGGDAWWVLAGYAPYPFMLAAGVAAFVGRPRGGWTTGPAIHPLVAVPIALSSITAFLTPLLPARPSAPGEPLSGWFETTFARAAVSEPRVVAYLAVTAVTIVALSVAVTRLRAGIAGAVLLVIAIPATVSNLGVLAQGLGQPELMVAPAGYVSTAASVVLLAAGVRWVREDPEAAPPAGH